MKSTLFIPKTITVGYQNRGDTYTGKLAYIIYTDEKGKLRKEVSWSNWRDNEIEPNTFDNEPTEGFVLNKKAGDYVSHWNHRQAYVRVYDPRGFEFEITIENLLHILENANSIKGKGLEGEFVYSWDGKELVLLSTASPDYKAITEYNETLHNAVKLKGKDLKLGATYLTRDNKQLVYLGRFDYWDSSWRDKLIDATGESYPEEKKKAKRYYFMNERYWNNEYVEKLSSLNNIISIVTEDCHEKYADWVDELVNNTYYNPIDRSKDEFVELSLEEFLEKHQSKLSDTGRYKNITFIDEGKKWRTVYAEVDCDEKVVFEEDRRDSYHWGIRNKLPGINSLEDLYSHYKPLKQQIFRANGQLHNERIDTKW